jgi:hypothetical protein
VSSVKISRAMSLMPNLSPVLPRVLFPVLGWMGNFMSVSHGKTKRLAESPWPTRKLKETTGKDLDVGSVHTKMKRTNITLPRVTSSYHDGYFNIDTEGTAHFYSYIVPFGDCVLILYTHWAGNSEYRDRVLRIYTNSDVMLSSQVAKKVSSCIQKINKEKHHKNLATHNEIQDLARRGHEEFETGWWRPENIKTTVACVSLTFNVDPEDFFFLETPGMQNIGVCY